MVLTYLDTSALMRRAEGLRIQCSTRNQKIAPYVDAILSNENRQLGCSEFTLLEFHSNLTTRWLDTNMAYYDEEWWEEARGDVLDRVADRSLAVLPTPSNAFEHVMALITAATRYHGRSLRAWDAFHVVTAARWSYYEGEPVEIVTSDADFDTILEFSGLTRRLSVLNLDIIASTGEGADKH